MTTLSLRDLAFLSGLAAAPTGLLNIIPSTFFADVSLSQCVTVESGGSVSSVQDALGRTGSFAQSTSANRPQYVSGTIPVLKFNRSAESKLSSSNVFFSGSSQSVLIVVKSANPSISGELILDTGPDSIGRRSFSFNNTSGQLKANLAGFTGTPITSSVSTFEWQAAAVVFNGSNSFIDVNGNRVTGTADMSYPSSAPYSIGGRFTGGSSDQFFNGNLAALIHLNGLWTNDDVSLLQGFFAWRLGFQALLTAGHSFRNSPPSITY